MARIGGPVIEDEYVSEKDLRTADQHSSSLTEEDVAHLLEIGNFPEEMEYEIPPKGVFADAQR